ncbi:MAG: DinB family protein [Thermomicrobiales bacterium]
MRVADLLTIYEYHYWAMDRILDRTALVSGEQFVAPEPVPSGSLRGTLVHVLDAECSWQARWQGQEEAPLPREEAFPTPADLTARWRENEAAMRAYQATLDDADLDRAITYRSWNGQTYTHILWQMLVHVANHGTQHRGEAALLLTEYGHSPGDIDFTVYLRAQPSPLAR